MEQSKSLQTIKQSFTFYSDSKTFDFGYRYGDPSLENATCFIERWKHRINDRTNVSSTNEIFSRYDNRGRSVIRWKKCIERGNISIGWRGALVISKVFIVHCFFSFMPVKNVWPVIQNSSWNSLEKFGAGVRTDFKSKEMRSTFLNLFLNCFLSMAKIEIKRKFNFNDDIMKSRIEDYDS